VDDDLRHTPGWYPDPSRRFQLRYFNGHQWTGDVAVDGQRHLDPLGLAGPATSTRGQTRAAAVASFVLALGALVTGWVPFIVVFSIVAAVLAVIFGIMGIRAARRQGGYGKGFAVAGLVISAPAAAACVAGVALSIYVWGAVVDWNEPGPYKVVPSSCAVVSGEATFEGTVANLSDRRRDYNIVVRITAVDGDHRDVVTVEGVDAGTTARWRAQRSVAGSSVTCVVTDVHGPDPLGLGTD
jgi:hypothetical protein